MTYEKVLEVFRGYLTEDDSCEVLTVSRGYLVVDWNSCKSEWVTSRLCQSPEHLRDVLRSSYEEYQGYLLTNGYNSVLLGQFANELFELQSDRNRAIYNERIVSRVWDDGPARTANTGENQGADGRPCEKGRNQPGGL